MRLGGGSRKAASKAEPAVKLARSERPSERQVRPLPTGAERCQGDVGAPTGAVHFKLFPYAPRFLRSEKN